MMMKAGKLLSLGLLSAAMFVACDTGSQPAPAGDSATRRQVTPMVNALTKAAAVQAGYGMSREAAADDQGFDFFNEQMAKQLEAAGVCSNFIDLLKEITQSSQQDSAFNWMTSSRFMDIVSCMESNASGLGENANPDAVMSVIDQCICAGSGTLFGALGYAWTGKYKSPELNTYKAPSEASYKSPSDGSYKSPNLPSYKSPSL